uniref:ShKT domain-containing protein n=1 Tax=Helicotheca tamesis TaxID=374047 RepID=A0A7S2IF24_9STRA
MTGPSSQSSHLLINHAPILAISTIAMILLPYLPIADSRMCVAAEESNYICTDDAVAALKASRKGNGSDEMFMQRGVPQRVDGNEVEREAVRHVLRQMEEYFQNEVLSKPDYESVRGRCKNMNELCAFWASVGECETNRGFMLTNCAASCRLCLLLHTNLN